ncbi:MAG: 4Fe-4S dicluster domain-containing protein [Clostridium thermopalmarium]|nr:4Fe-4S dicluster domain-containing protein [Clostridium thermopalmarium]
MLSFQKYTNEGTEEDLLSLKELAETIKNTSLCGLGQTAPNPVLSSMRYFPDEYLAHVKDKHCPALVCRSLLTFEITDKCIGCTKCARNCPALCISGELKEKHFIDTDKCIKCGTCITMCPIGAIIKK